MDAEFFSVEHAPAQASGTRSLELPPEQADPTHPAVTVIAEGLSKFFRSGGEMIHAVDEVSFTFTEGQFVAILGSSGSGKSTLLYLLGGLDKPTSDLIP